MAKLRSHFERDGSGMSEGTSDRRMGGGFVVLKSFLQVSAWGVKCTLDLRNFSSFFFLVSFLSFSFRKWNLMLIF